MFKTRISRVCIALLGASTYLHAMEPILSKSAHPEFVEGRCDTNHAKALDERRRMEKPSKHYSALSAAVESDSLDDAATFALYKLNPNRKETRTFKETTFELPIYYSARSKRMAAWLLMLGAGADYTLRAGKDRGTVLHHMCTNPPTHQFSMISFQGDKKKKVEEYFADKEADWTTVPYRVDENGQISLSFASRGNQQDIIEMFKFYLDNKVDVHTVDDNGRTALHRIALHLGDYSLDLSIPFALLLLRAGSKLKKKDHSGKRFKDYLREQQFMPGSVGANSHILLAYVEGQTEKPRDVRYNIQQHDTLFCEEEHPLPAEDADALTLRKMKKLLPLIPERCEDVSCKSLRVDPACAHGRELLQYKHGFAPWPSDKVTALIQKEIAKALLDWHAIRSWIAMNITARQFTADDDITSLMTHALIEDDCALMQHMLRHQYPYTECNALGPRSADMVKLLHHYSKKSKWCDPFVADFYGNTPFHYLAQHGALVQKEVYNYYVKLGINPLAVNKEGLTPLEILAENSYRFDGKEEQLALLAGILWGRGVSMHAENPITGKSLLDIAKATYATWQLPVTARFVELLIWWNMAYVYNNSPYVRGRQFIEFV